MSTSGTPLLSMSDRQISIPPEEFVKTVRPGEHG